MNIAVAQSGGPTCVINSSLCGVVREALKSEKIAKIYGSLNGIEGVLKDNLIVLNEVLGNEENQELLRQTPSSALGSCRFKLPEYENAPEIYENIEKTFEKYGIEMFFYIGGNDSMDTTVKLSRYFAKKNSPVRVVGIPKTIDNDLIHTDHTPGFGSAAKYVLTSLNEIIRDTEVYDLKSVMIVEIMGRQAGWLSASSCVLRTTGINKPQLIYLPESEFDVNKFVSDVKKELEKDNIVIIAVSEGIEINEIEDEQSKADGFGHKQMGGVGQVLEEIVKEKIGCKVRSVELNVLQRCASHSASLTDIEEAEQAGAFAVSEGLAGKTGVMVSFERISNEPYEIKYKTVDATPIANGEKAFPSEWINEEKNNVTDEAIPYFLPLIQGEVQTITEYGIPKHIKLK